jgi:hypothetical protein
VNNCPSCKNVISELKLSKIKGKLASVPAFDCVTLCCSFCGVIVMAIPDLASQPVGVTGPPNGH